MGYHVLAEATMVAHFAFLVYLLIGGFLAWRWPRAIWPHFAVAAWGLLSTVFVWDCPLTHLENWARRRAGEQGLTAGFIDTYLTGVVYPERYTGLIQLGVAVVVAISWTGAFLRHRRRRQARLAAGSP